MLYLIYLVSTFFLFFFGRGSGVARNLCSWRLWPFTKTQVREEGLPSECSEKRHILCLMIICSSPILLQLWSFPFITEHSHQQDWFVSNRSPISQRDKQGQLVLSIRYNLCFSSVLSPKSSAVAVKMKHSYLLIEWHECIQAFSNCLIWNDY